MWPAGRVQDTGATFWNELEEETELYEGREQDLLAAPRRATMKTDAGVELNRLQAFVQVAVK